MHRVSGPEETHAVMSVPLLLLWINVTASEHSMMHLENAWSIYVLDVCDDDCGTFAMHYGKCVGSLEYENGTFL